MTININLLPWREALNVEHRKAFLFLLVCSIAFTLALFLGIHCLMARQITVQNSHHDYLKHQTSLLVQRIQEIEDLEKEKKQLLARMEIIQQLQKSRPEVVRLFDGLVRIVPDGLYLTKISRKGSKILIDGKAESNTRVSIFMRNIEGSPWIKSPILSLIQADDQKVGDHLIGFNLQANDVGSAPTATPVKSNHNKKK